MMMTPEAAAQSGASAEAAELFKQGRVALGGEGLRDRLSEVRLESQARARGGHTDQSCRLRASDGQVRELPPALGRKRQTFADISHDALNRGVYARKKFAEIDKRVPKLTVRLRPLLRAIRRSS